MWDVYSSYEMATCFVYHVCDHLVVLRVCDTIVSNDHDRTLAQDPFSYRLSHLTQPVSVGIFPDCFHIVL